MYDLIIIGGGPAGYRAAELAGHNRLKTLLFEQRALGGVCLNEGCIPTKTLLYSAKLRDGAAHGEEYGVRASGAEIDHAAVIARKNTVASGLVAGIMAKLRASGVEVIYASASVSGRTGGGYAVASENVVREAKNLLICTGSVVSLPPIEGLKGSLDDGFAVTSREILDLSQRPDRLCVVGGGIIGLELASYFNSAGAAVGVIEMTDRIAAPSDRGLAEMLRKEYEKKGVEFYLSSRVTRIGGGEVRFTQNGEERVFACDRVLVCAGRRPNAVEIGLEALGVVTERGAVVTDERMKTNLPGVYAAGDCNGKSMLAHTAYREAEVAVNNILGKKDYVDYSAIPSAVYTTPELAWVGLTAEQAEANGFSAEEKTVPMAYSGRFSAENAGGSGAAKFVYDRLSGRLLGAHILGGAAAEMVTAFTLMIERRMNKKTIQSLVFPHPTVAEIMRETLF